LLAVLRLLLMLLAATLCDHVELCDLVSILARSGYLDWAGPVEVEVTQREGKLLQLNLRKVGVVLRHVEVRWQHTALSRIRRCQEEVKH
jgi:hypothetical protein